MVDITHKNNTLRIATAQAIVRVSDAKTIEAIENNLVPKGNVFEMSRAAGLLGIKKTPDLLPDCHPLPIEYAHISYEIEGLEIKISVCVKTIYKTGVEVEAMHGASIVALNMYDMLKPIDTGVEIFHIKLLEKKGGKSDFKSGKEKINAAVIVCSDSIAEGKNEDYAGKKIIELLEKYDITTSDYKVIADDKILIENEVQEMVQKSIPLIIFTGGTGLSPRDNTPEAIQPLLEKHIPGIEEAIRNYGQNRTQFAMLSRSLAGMIGDSLVLALPGSVKGAEESIHAIFPAILHVFDIIKGAKH